MLKKLTAIIILTSCVAISGTASIKSDKNRIKDREQKIATFLNVFRTENRTDGATGSKHDYTV